MAITGFLENKDWYDNSRLDVILSCKRKAFNGQLIETSAGAGLEAPVGAGAKFGTAMHGFAATYYSWWGKETEANRRIRGMRKFLELHEENFVGQAIDDLDTKHSKENGLHIIDHYCDTHLAEDELLIPVELELSGAVQITYLEGLDLEPFDPFWYAFKIDGIHQRRTYGDYWVREMKNTGMGVKRELVKLQLSRQPTGYVWVARQFPGVEVTGCMPDVVGVMARTKECQRDYFPKSRKTTNDWRTQTINIVNYWRALQSKAAGLTFENVLNTFYQTTAACTDYGLCAFYELCRDGYSPATLAKFGPARWNPLADDSPVETKQIQTETGIKESLRII